MKTEYDFINGELVVHCNRTIHKFEPYFYVRADARVPILKEIVRVEQTTKRNLYNDKLKRIVTRTPRDVGIIREHFSWVGEADIRFTKRFNIDKKITQTNTSKVFIDIENVVKKGQRPDVGKYPISVIGIYHHDVYHQWVFHPKLFCKSIDTTWTNRLTKHKSKRVIHQFNLEYLLLIDFMSYIMYHKPDVIIEWSKTPYDIACIISRMSTLNIQYKRLSPINRVKYDRYPDIGCIETISLLPYYKKHHIGEIPSDKLDNVCKDEFNIGKTEIVDDFEEIWNNKLPKLLEYNCGDVESMVNLNNETELLDNIQYIIDYIGCELEDYLSPTSIIRHYLLKKANEYNLVLDNWQYENIISFTGYNKEYFNRPEVTLLEHRKDFNLGLVKLNKRFKTSTEEKSYYKRMNKQYNGIVLFSITGAHVMEPQKGIHDKIDLYDFRSLYPNIIIERNMSPETLVRYGDKDKYKPEDLYDIGNGVYFMKPHIKVGFVPRVLKELFAMRYNVKDQMKGLDRKSKKYKILDKQQKGIKYIINSFYGVMKHICIWIAESITFTGRNMIMWTIDKSKELGCDVMYGDTDSVYITNAKENLGSILQEMMKKEFGLSIELEHEDSFKKAYFITKKRYVIQRYDDTFKYKGIEIKRANESEFIKNTQKKVIEMIFDDTNKSDIMKYLRDELNTIQDKSPTYVGRNVRLNFNRKTKNKITKFEIAAQVANRTLYKHYETGDRPCYLPGICFDYDSEVDITDAMLSELKDEFVNKVQLLFNGLGWNADELKSKYVQRRLEI